MKLVANKISRFDLSFEVDATPDYTAEDVVDGLLTIQAAGRYGLSSGEIVGAVLHNAASHAIDMHIVFFKDNPSNSTFTDNSAITIHDDDLDKVLGVLTLSRHYEFAGNSVAMPAINQQPIPFELGVNSEGECVTSLYAVVIAGGTVNFAATTDLSGAIFIRQD